MNVKGSYLILGVFSLGNWYLSQRVSLVVAVSFIRGEDCVAKTQFTLIWQIQNTKHSICQQSADDTLKKAANEAFLAAKGRVWCLFVYCPPTRQTLK